MFVGEQARLDVGFAAAQAFLARGGLLAEVSRWAYAQGITTLHQTPDPGTGSRAPYRAAGLPELVQVQARELLSSDAIAILAVRWQAWDPAAGLFPALDADLTLTPDPPATVLMLAATYRPPPGHAAGLDQAVVYQAASATITSFFSRIAEALPTSDADYP